jgi:hypothetical protein
MATKSTSTKVSKAAAPKAPAKKVASQKPAAAVKAPAVKKPAAAAKAPAVKKPAAVKAPAVKQAGKSAKAPLTKIIAQVDVGFGNELFLRGEGAGLSWEKGTLMQCVSDSEWAFATDAAKTGVVFKFLLNDVQWSDGEDMMVAAGGTSISSPSFS